MMITAEALAALPIRRYEGEVVLVETAADLARAAAELMRPGGVVGFDTETRPAFRVGESYLPSLFQAATERTASLFPVQRLDCAPVLTALLASNKVVKAGVSVADDLKKLKQVFPFEEDWVVDVGQVAKKNGIKQT